MTKQEIKNYLLEQGYEERGYGYYKNSDNEVHWVTMFKDEIEVAEKIDVELYCYPKGLMEETTYKTGIIQVESMAEFTTIHQVLFNSHNF